MNDNDPNNSHTHAKGIVDISNTQNSMPEEQTQRLPSLLLIVGKHSEKGEDN